MSDRYSEDYLRDMDEAISSIDFDRSRTEMQADFKKAGIETKDQILELIRDVKKELDRERQEREKSY